LHRPASGGISLILHSTFAHKLQQHYFDKFSEQLSLWN